MLLANPHQRKKKKSPSMVNLGDSLIPADAGSLYQHCPTIGHRSSPDHSPCLIVQGKLGSSQKNPNLSLRTVFLNKNRKIGGWFQFQRLSLFLKHLHVFFFQSDRCLVFSRHSFTVVTVILTVKVYNICQKANRNSAYNGA